MGSYFCEAWRFSVRSIQILSIGKLFYLQIAESMCSMHYGEHVLICGILAAPCLGHWQFVAALVLDGV